jgi:hypothetical protein
MLSAGERALMSGVGVAGAAAGAAAAASGDACGFEQAVSNTRMVAERNAMQRFDEFMA